MKAKNVIYCIIAISAIMANVNASAFNKVNYITKSQSRSGDVIINNIVSQPGTNTLIYNITIDGKKYHIKDRSGQRYTAEQLKELLRVGFLNKEDGWWDL